MPLSLLAGQCRLMSQVPGISSGSISLPGRVLEETYLSVIPLPLLVQFTDSTVPRVLQNAHTHVSLNFQATEEADDRRCDRRAADPALRRQRRDPAQALDLVPSADSARRRLLQGEGNLEAH